LWNVAVEKGDVIGVQWRLAVDTECQYGSKEKGIRQIPEKKWENSETVHQVFIDLKKAYDSLRRGILYNILF
jgi:hypothetical protein